MITFKKYYTTHKEKLHIFHIEILSWKIIKKCPKIEKKNEEKPFSVYFQQHK